jgi:hypothetical protein
VHKEFVPEGKTEKAEFFKGVMDSLLKRIHRVRPAAFCCRDFFFVARQISRPQTCKCLPVLTPKMLQPFINPPPRTLQIYLRQIIFCSPT